MNEILKELDNEILNLIPADKDIEHEIDSAGVFRESIYEVIVHIDEVLEGYESKKISSIAIMVLLLLCFIIT